MQSCVHFAGEEISVHVPEDGKEPAGGSSLRTQRREWLGGGPRGEGSTVKQENSGKVSFEPKPRHLVFRN